MRATIRNKMIWGFSGVLLLMGVVAAIGMYAVFSLRQSARDATRIGGRLNAIALEIQVHNLEAERRVKDYLHELKQLGAVRAREKYLDEANFEVSAIESPALKAMAIASTAEKREKFRAIADESGAYQSALAALVNAAEESPESQKAIATRLAYEDEAKKLHDYAEDGEAAGRDASQSSQDDIDRTSKSSVALAFGVSLVGLLLGSTMSYKLNRAILIAEEASAAKSNLLAEIERLNAQLKQDNNRMSTELEVTRRLQQMMLPHEVDLKSFANLDIAGHMDPASEVGGDYYDVVHKDEGAVFCIGDVTGHGLESGVIAIMVQTAVRTLLASGLTESHQFLEILNRVIFDNTRQMNCDRNLTFSLMHYKDKHVIISGQHEEVLIVRRNGKLERHDTLDLGFPLGLEQNISSFIDERKIPLETGDVMVVYTDGITEAINGAGTAYGIERLCQSILDSSSNPSEGIRKAVLADLNAYIGDQRLLDDISLLIVKPSDDHILAMHRNAAR